MNEVMVSIICLCYNQEQYIEKCLESLIHQKFKYSYEIIIHDDCSTDNSKCIIEKYAKLYPNIIKPIFETENQFKKRGLGKMFRECACSVISLETKYVAICEADDYWCDRLKLQKQVDALEENQNCGLCLAKVLKITDSDENMNEYLPPTYIQNGVIKSRDFIRMVCCEDYAFQTSSYMFRMDYFRQLRTIPKFIEVCNIYDQVLQLFFGNKADVYYINEVMSCYRVLSKGSWTSKNLFDIQPFLDHQRNMIETMEEYNKYTNGQYDDYCTYFINKRKWKIAYLNGDHRELLKKEYRQFFKQLSFKEKSFIFICAYFPKLMSFKH